MIKRRVSAVALAVVFSLPTILPSAAQASVECPKPAKTNDPFADLDDMMTDDEKRAALHSELDRKLAQHKSPCDLKQNQQKPASSNASTAAQAGGQADGGQQSQTDPGDQGTNSAPPQNAANSQSPQQASSSESTSQQSQSGQSAQAQQNNQANQTNQSIQNSQTNPSSGSGQYTSPWAPQPDPSAGAGKVMLEQMAQPAQEPSEEPQATTPDTPGTTGTPGIPEQSGEQPPKENSGTVMSQTEPTEPQDSLFLRTYGGQSALEGEKIEDIADRSAAGGLYGSPGNTGVDRQTPYYPSSNEKPAQTATIGADDAVLTALKKRLKAETDPEKKKALQAEIDKYEKK